MGKSPPVKRLDWLKTISVARKKTPPVYQNVDDTLFFGEHNHIVLVSF